MKHTTNMILIIIAIATVFGVGNFVRAQQNNEKISLNLQKGFEYQLAYPGILPDHPLYPVKMVRDNLISLLISNPLKKTDFYLLMADKRINSAKYLSEKGKGKNHDKLMISTLSKGQNYYDLAIDQLVLEKNKGTNVNNLLEKMIKAGLKHEIVLREIITRLPDEEKGAVRDMLERTKKMREKVVDLLK